jgi:hypothetical protein
MGLVKLLGTCVLEYGITWDVVMFQPGLAWGGFGFQNLQARLWPKPGLGLASRRLLVGRISYRYGVGRA